MTSNLLAKIKAYNPKADTSIVEKAFAFAAKAHKDHKRLSGDPYITHPFAVANVLADLEQDVFTIAAAFLHDVVEDAGVTKEELSRLFGSEVSKLVEGVTKLSQLTFVSREERQAENFRKMFVAMGEDFRILVIKLADRLHNMETLSALSLEKQKETAQETREIYAPLAHRMGMWRLKWRLEDLAFLYLEPDKYEYIKNKVAESRADREKFIKNFIEQLKKMLVSANIAAEVNGRAKHFFSIYCKMTDQHLEFDQIYDLTAVRIIADDLKSCYAILGLAHDEWKPIHGRFRDYIAMPKSNGYQSLHTTIFGDDGRPVEIQIRTRQMHRIAEYGVAAHWRYKEGDTDKLLDRKMAWLREMLEWQSELKDAKEFMENLKISLVVDEVFVFSPKGDVFGLPLKATPIDFAYRVHTEVGHRCVGAKVNGRIVPLDSTLSNGDIVEIITGKKDSPSKDWIGFVKTTGARIKIKNWFKKQIGDKKEPPADPVVTIKTPSLPRQKIKTKKAVKVAGLDNILVRFGKCCFPVPGEEIVGFVTLGKGVSIHRHDCPNIMQKNAASDKMVRVDWNLDSGQVYPVEIEIEAFDRVGVFKDILEQISGTGTNISGAKVSTRRGGIAGMRIVIDVKDVRHLNRVIEVIRKVADVYTIKRK